MRRVGQGENFEEFLRICGGFGGIMTLTMAPRSRNPFKPGGIRVGVSIQSTRKRTATAGNGTAGREPTSRGNPWRFLHETEARRCPRRESAGKDPGRGGPGEYTREEV